MPLSAEAAIADALNRHLAGLVLSPVLPVAWPGLPFNPPAEGYLEATFLPNRSTSLAVTRGSVRHIGFYQVTVVALAASGIVKALDLAGVVIDWFGKDTRLDQDGIRLRIMEQPWTAPPLQDPDRLRIPVSIPYVAFEKLA